MKTCTKCLNSKPFSAFYKRHDEKGYRQPCIECYSVAGKDYRAKNYEEVKERGKLSAKRHRKLYPHKVNAYNAAKRKRTEKATPPWLTKESFDSITRVYKLAASLTKVLGREFEVDHVVPLQGLTVCGLHVPWNLEVCSREENRSKKNRWCWETQK